MRNIELITAINNVSFLEAACESPADGIYIPLSGLVNIRWKRDFFSQNQLDDLVAAAHRARKKLYPVINGQIVEAELAIYRDAARRIYASGADGLVLGDPGLLAWVRENIFLNREFKLIASSSASARTSEDLSFWSSEGADRVILPRLQSLSDISDISCGSPLELELFVHGLICPVWEGVSCLWPKAAFAERADWGCCVSLDGQKAPCTQYSQADGRPFWTPQVYSDLQILRLLPELNVASIKVIPAAATPEAFRSTLDLWRKAMDQIQTSGQGPFVNELESVLPGLSPLPVSFDLRRL